MLEHQQLGAVEMADDRHAGRDARGGLVDRVEVVQVQDVGLGRTGALERRGPGVDVALVLLVAHAREHLVGGVRAVLVGGLHRRLAGVEVDGDGVQPRVEGVRVGAAVRTAQDRDVPAARRQLASQRAGDVRGSAARKEHEGTEDTHLMCSTR